MNDLRKVSAVLKDTPGGFKETPDGLNKFSGVPGGFRGFQWVLKKHNHSYGVSGFSWHISRFLDVSGGSKRGFGGSFWRFQVSGGLIEAEGGYQGVREVSGIYRQRVLKGFTRSFKALQWVSEEFINCCLWSLGGFQRDFKAFQGISLLY